MSVMKMAPNIRGLANYDRVTKKKQHRYIKFTALLLTFTLSRNYLLHSNRQEEIMDKCTAILPKSREHIYVDHEIAPNNKSSSSKRF